MFRHQIFGSLVALSVSFSQVTWAQDKPPEGERPKIRLSGEEAAAPAEKPEGPPTKKAQSDVAPGTSDKPAPQAAPAARSTSADSEESEGTDSEESEGTAESVESVVGSQPAEGLGPAEAVTDAPKDDGDRVDLSEPRVIDISAADEKPMDPKDLPPEEPKVPASQLPFTYHVNHIDVHGGFRIVGTYDDGLQPFLVDPVMADVYVRGGIAFGITDRIAIAPHLEFGGGSATATVRDLDTQIDKVHATLGIEGRYHFIHRMFGYARLAPGFEFVGATLGLEDTSSELSTGDFPGSVGFQFDAALGASLRLFGPNDGRKRDPRLWIFAEGGYRASTKHELSLSVDEDDGPRRAASIDLAPLHFSGGFFSTGLMASF